MAYSSPIATLATSLGASSGGTSSAIDTSGADIIFVAVSSYTGRGYTLSDSKSNTWTPLTAYGASPYPQIQIYYCVSPVNGSGHTFTVSSTGSDAFPAIGVLAFSGAKTASPFDAESGNSKGSSSGTTLAAGSITPSEDDEIVISALADNASASTSIDSGFTKDAGVAQVGGVSFGVSIAHLIQTTAGAANPTWTLDGVPAGAANACFKAQPSGGVTVSTRVLP